MTKTTRPTCPWTTSNALTNCHRSYQPPCLFCSGHFTLTLTVFLSLSYLHSLPYLNPCRCPYPFVTLTTSLTPLISTRASTLPCDHVTIIPRLMVNGQWTMINSLAFSIQPTRSGVSPSVEQILPESRRQLLPRS